MFDMGGLADHAFHQDDRVHRPADRRHLLRAQPVAGIVDRDMRFGRSAERERRVVRDQVVDELSLEGAGLGERVARAQGDGLAVLDPVEAQRKGRAVETVERRDGTRQPVGRGVVEIEQRDEGDVEEMRAARRIVARERGDLSLLRGGRLGHDVEGVSGAHGWGLANGGTPSASFLG